MALCLKNRERGRFKPMSRKNKTSLIILIVLVIAVGTLIYFQGSKNLRVTNGKSPIRLGMDLQGGVMLVMEVLQPPTGELNVQTVEDAKNAMEKRIDMLGVVEPEIERLSGDNWNRINVSLPGITDLKQALDVLGKQGMLSFKLDGITVLSGGDLLSDAKSGYSSNSAGAAAVHLQLKSNYAAQFKSITGSNIGKTLEIYIDDEQVVSGTIQSEIPDGQCEISGGMSLSDASSIAAILRGGVLPAPVEHKETRFVDASLGSEVANKSLIAGLIGIFAVFAFMIFLYRGAGVIASVALMIYIGLILAVYMTLGATLSLAGIAGFVLSIGMAVDANVIIFERIKEELKAGKRVSAAVDGGFHKAFSAIFDGNLTTLITSAVLFYFGAAKIQGFAVMLAIGIAVSMFTAIVVTRMILDIVVGSNSKIDIKFFGGGGERA